MPIFLEIVSSSFRLRPGLRIGTQIDRKFKALFSAGSRFIVPEGSGVYVLATKRWGIRTKPGSFYVGLTHDFRDRCSPSHDRWGDMIDAPMLFIQIESEDPSFDHRSCRLALEGEMRHALSAELNDKGTWMPNQTFGLEQVVSEGVKFALGIRNDALKNADPRPSRA